MNLVRYIPLVGGLLVGVALFAYSWFGDHYDYVSDDAGITLRYAERIAQGSGFNYNDGEAVNGASNPLYTLTEAALLRLGCSPETAILLIASVCFALTAGLLFETFARFYSRGAAVFSVVALVAFNRPFETIVDGMETPLVTLLAALLFRALHGRGEVLPGIVLGCLVASKLDGALASIAFAAVFVLGRRRLPWRAASIALLAAAPVFLLLLANFGSILPNSMLVKASMHSRVWNMDHFWLHKLLLEEGFWSLYFLAGASLLWLPLARELQRSFPVAVVQMWFVLYMVTFATVNLGAPYPWYEATPVILSVILASFTVHALACAKFVRPRWLQLTWDPVEPPRRMWPVALAIVAVFAWKQGQYVAGRLRIEPTDHALLLSDSGEIARQAAGAWLRKHSSGTESFCTFEGLPAYEYGGPVYDHSLLNSNRDDARLEYSAYSLTGPLDPEAEVPRVYGYGKLVASFRYDAKMGPYAIYALEDSEIWRKGVRHLTFPTPALWSGRPAEGRGSRVAHYDNTWILPATGHAFFTVRSWSPVSLFFTPRLVRAPEHATASLSAVRIVVLENDVELGSTEVLPGEDQVSMRLVTTRDARTGEYTFEIDCRSLGSEESGRTLVELTQVLVRSGEPLRPGDFKLTSERVRKRIEYVATQGLPCGFFRR